MALPEQLQKQVDNAREVIAQHYGPKTDETAATEPPAADATTEQAPAPTAPVAATPAETQATPARDDENSATYAQRWRSLQGQFQATKRMLDEQQSRTATLEQLISQMQTAPAVAAGEKTSHVTDKDVTEYGNDMVEFARRVAKEEMVPVARALAELNRRIDQLNGLAPVVKQVAAQQQDTAEERFFANLGAQVSDWEQINADAKFHNWLLTPDDMTGITRQTYLEDAHRTHDLARVVSIFNAWKRVSGVDTAQSQSQSTQRTRAATQLERQVAPGRAAAGSSAPQPKEQKMWSRADIVKFYDDRLRGVYKGREAEATAMERDIFLAQREGRVALRAA